MTQPPTPGQLDHLLGHAESRRLSPQEAALLRAGVQHLCEAAARAEAWARHWSHQAARARTAADRARALHQPQTLAGRPADCHEPTPFPTARALTVHFSREETCSCQPNCPADTAHPET
ncbi:hypothetical protein OH807_30655 [Kitasatospora sp. NBC_01560]|uniref:hypothetical protein n=1 Tax=Kitasatospora sp. NBC_01560 TaxID=2975965 RepID=UPI0038679DEE